LCFVLFPARGIAQDLPVPAEPDLAEALRVVKDAFGAEYSSAKTNAQKQKLARKMLDTVAETKAPVSRFALLQVARDIATQGCDGQTAFLAIDEMGKTFRIDVVRMKTSVLYSLAKKTRLPADRKSIAEQALALADIAVGRDDFELSGKLATVALSEAKKLREAGYLKAVASRVDEIEEIGEAYAEVRTASEELEADPTDPEANLAVGKYRCLVKGDWENGLPMLALGSDADLKRLATKELRRPTDAAEHVELADGWWDLSQQQEGRLRHRFQERAAYWYAAAVAQLAGLDKARAVNRIRMVSAHGEPEIVNLLSLVDPTKHALRGKWQRHNGGLRCDGGGVCLIEFPYSPSFEYDFRITFTRVRGDDTVAMLCSAAGRQFSWYIACYQNRISVFRRIDGHGDERGVENNPTCRTSTAWIVNGRRYVWTVKVRADKVQAWQGHQLISEWKTDYSDMGPLPQWKATRSDMLGLGVLDATVFHSIEVVNVSGRGRKL
jgi:hypothetical protein